MNERLSHSWQAISVALGVAGGVFFCLSRYGVTTESLPGLLCLILTFLPVTMLAASGIAYGIRAFALSMAAGFLITALLQGMVAAMVLGLLVMIPTGWGMLWQRGQIPGQAGLPASPVILAQGMTYLAALALCLTAALVWQEPAPLPELQATGMEGVIQARLLETLQLLAEAGSSDLSPDAETHLLGLSLFIPATGAWVSILLFLGFFRSGQRLAARLPASEPSVVFMSPALSSTMLGLLALAGLASVMGSDNMTFLGRSLFLVFLLPYFVSGMLRLRLRIQHWPSPNAALAGLYGVLLLFVWPVFLIAFWALAQHCASYLRLSSPPAKPPE